MGKRLNLIQRNSFQTRAYLTGLRYNQGIKWHEQSWRKIFHRNPGKQLQKIIERKPSKSPSRVKKQNREQPVPTDNLDYGKHAEMPELTNEEVEEAGTRFLEQLEVKKYFKLSLAIDVMFRLQVTSRDDRDRIAQETVGQFQNPLYMNHRQNRLTASNFGRVVCCYDWTPCHNLVKDILRKGKAISTPAMEYGKVNEDVAIKKLETLRNISVQPTGLWIDLVHNFLAASPDGTL